MFRCKMSVGVYKRNNFHIYTSMQRYKKSDNNQRMHDGNVEENSAALSITKGAEMQDLKWGWVDGPPQRLLS